MKNLTSVRVRTEDVVLPTYLPAPPDKNPMFLEKRVYQGSSGKVYPLPFTDRIAEKAVERKWKTIWLENEFLRVMILPELGGRIHRLVDVTNGYDLVYYQPVIKPALVGLAGPWASGGIEFNWPQHHRPATFLPVDTHIEKHPDGSVTVWCGDHDPMCRMKGMHGVCLHPGKAYLELKVRVHNRTPLTQTFLWWANVATRAHEGYQSFFPPDVHYVADHAKRAMSNYPLCQGHYYGVNYGERGKKGAPPEEMPANYVPAHCQPKVHSSKFKAQGKLQSSIAKYAPNDLSWYANIPVPTSYMCLGSQNDFFGGYDHFAQAGIVHIADHHIAPGKKQWTWGNHEFGYAWDRNLTEADERGECGPYLELMAGVFTDNQPDFSFLQPGETRRWSQYWYPIQKIGPAQHANLAAAVSLRFDRARESATLFFGVSVTSAFPKAKVVLSAKGKSIVSFTRSLAPGNPFTRQIKIPKGMVETELTLRVLDRDGSQVIEYTPQPPVTGDVPAPATEPPAPKAIASADELYQTGLHLDQYRHATRCPTLYWREALRRDALDARCNNAMGVWHLKRGELAEAETHFRHAIQRLILRNPNPPDGEAYYNLGLCMRYQLDALPNFKSEISNLKFKEAYAAFYKATWNQAWAGASFHALAEMDCLRGHWPAALDHLNHSLRGNSENLRARNLLVIVLRRLGRMAEAKVVLRDTLAMDPLDVWARQLQGGQLAGDLQSHLDIAHDYARAGFWEEAVQVLSAADFSPRDLPDQSWGALPMVYYTLGWLNQKQDKMKSAKRHFGQAAVQSADYCFPHRLEEIAILQSAIDANPQDARAPYYLGNLFYDRRRHKEAIQLWERSAKLDSANSVVWRNLGIGYFNVLQRPNQARAAYNQAFRANSCDARLLYERDQLWKRLGDSPRQRLRELEKYSERVRQRDDLAIELGSLYNQVGQHDRALELIRARHFQPWEGGEGQALGQHVRTHLALGRAALNRDEAPQALEHFQSALTCPPNLGEAKHLLANQSDIHYWLGIGLSRLHQITQARQHWRKAATFSGDFQEMSARAFSEMTYYSALAWRQLGQEAKANRLFKELLAYARTRRKTPAKIDYFATSLPTMLLFEEDLQFRQATSALFLEAQARLGLNQPRQAAQLLATVLRRDPNHALAADLAETVPRRYFPGPPVSPAGGGPRSKLALASAFAAKSSPT